MKVTKINFLFIIFYEIIELLPIARNDHVKLIRCSTEPQCLENLNERLLAVIEENLDNTTRPCENFWKYACGSWTSAPYYDHADNFGAVANYYADSLIEILKELQNTTQHELRELVDQLMKYFLSCRSLENHKLKMALYLKELSITEIFVGNFASNRMFQAHDTLWQDFNWLKALAYLRKYGFKEIFLHESVAFAWNNSRQYVIELKMPAAKSNFQNKYQILKLMEEFDLIVDYNDTKKTYFLLAADLYKFDKKLLALYKSHQLTNQQYFIVLQDLPYLTANIDWLLYFKIILGEEPPLQTPIELSGNLKYFQDLYNLFAETPKSVQGFYILIRFCQYLMVIRPLITDRECLLHTNVMFPIGVNYVYDKFLYKNRLEDERILQTLFSLLKAEFSKILQKNKFSLSAQELLYLQDKLSLMQLKIGNLPLVWQDINHYYSSVQIKPHDFYSNHLKMLEFRTLKQHQELLNSLRQPLNLATYYLNDDISQLRNAPYFIHQRNTLIIPMIFLQLPFYHYAQHPVLQFSLIGWIMAHELSHAFDTHGLNFDAWGNENLWGHRLSQNPTFQSATGCLTKHSPAVSLNERMADVNGLQLAWQTFYHQISQNGEFYGSVSVGKLFFINFSQFFCGSLPRPIAHDRDDIRVRHSVANVREFADLFHCSSQTKENPNDKCYIWSE